VGRGHEDDDGAAQGADLGVLQRRRRPVDRAERPAGEGPATVEDPSADSSLGIFEWSAPDDCPIDDPNMWRLANPSLGYPQGISHEALRAALETDPEPIFRTECLCQRVPDLVPSKIPLTAWVKCADPASQMVGGLVLSWEVSWNRSRAAIGVAGYRRTACRTSS
jgi:hypothetical protein